MIMCFWGKQKTNYMAFFSENTMGLVRSSNFDANSLFKNKKKISSNFVAFTE
jgi:hypothetical protein